MHNGGSPEAGNKYKYMYIEKYAVTQFPKIKNSRVNFNLVLLYLLFWSVWATIHNPIESRVALNPALGGVIYASSASISREHTQ